ncbi:unnamed protein product [Cunninghamella blakesleeana]
MYITIICFITSSTLLSTSITTTHTHIHSNSNNNSITTNNNNPTNTTKTIISTIKSTSLLSKLHINHIINNITHILCILALYTIHFFYLIYIAQKTLRTSLNHRYHQLMLQYYHDQTTSKSSLLLLLSSSLSSLEKEQDNNNNRLLTLIQQDKEKLSKIPNHLAITISDELVFERSQDDWNHIIHDICQTSCWAFEIGIKELSIYDPSDTLKSMAIDIYKQQSNTLHEWCIRNHHQDDDKNKFRFSIYSKDDVNSEITQVNQKIYQHVLSNKLSTDDINVSLVDEFMQETMSDPELMIIYDGLPHHYVSLNGFFPWHIRLTEFINVTSYHRLNYSLFSSCLYRYSKVEQRFGH